ASTFGSSTEFYDAIPEAGAISCYLPAGESRFTTSQMNSWWTANLLHNQNTFSYSGVQKHRIIMNQENASTQQL
ncbi:MAG: hypothetical protein ACLUGJ_18675, partial [Blautia wexlerae]